MNMPNNLSFIFISFCLVLFASCVRQDDFEKIPTKSISDTLFSKSNTPINAFIEEGFEKKKNGNVVRLAKEGLSKTLSFDYIAIVSYVGDSYIGIISGLPIFEAGWQFWIYPTYSNITIVDKKTLNVVLERKVRDSVSEVTVVDGFVYFEYGTYPNLKYGRFKL